mmetsp:Transcript_49004/g.123276  ORF Transcript_49004/g.123276 Transcript_49004/m.123276 type:complete len:201 (+) Transcript_49004:728-1330(+)
MRSVHTGGGSPRAAALHSCDAMWNSAGVTAPATLRRRVTSNTQPLPDGAACVTVQLRVPSSFRSFSPPGWRAMCVYCRMRVLSRARQSTMTCWPTRYVRASSPDGTSNTSVASASLHRVAPTSVAAFCADVRASAWSGCSHASRRRGGLYGDHPTGRGACSGRADGTQHHSSTHSLVRPCTPGIIWRACSPASTSLVHVR